MDKLINIIYQENKKHLRKIMFIKKDINFLIEIKSIIKEKNLTHNKDKRVFLIYFSFIILSISIYLQRMENNGRLLINLIFGN